MESFSDNLLLCIFTIALVELGEPGFAVVVEDEDRFDHGEAAGGGRSSRPGHCELCPSPFTLAAAPPLFVQIGRAHV